MSIRLDIDRIPELKNIGHALIDFVEDICSGITFQKKGRRWVGSKRFVTFTIQHAQAKSIAISLRGNRNEFPQNLKELRLKVGRAQAYTECTLENPRQLAEVALCIQRAYDLYNKGSVRSRKRLEIKEE